MSVDDEQAAFDQVDTSVPSVARMYDYSVGGKDNFEVDRTAMQDMMLGAPEMVRVARENRAFLGRARGLCRQRSRSARLRSRLAR